jgi:hypothetical protein
MPFEKRKLPGRDLYRVRNIETGRVHAKGTTLKKANAMLWILRKAEGGEKYYRKKKSKFGGKNVTVVGKSYVHTRRILRDVQKGKKDPQYVKLVMYSLSKKIPSKYKSIVSPMVATSEQKNSLLKMIQKIVSTYKLDVRTRRMKSTSPRTTKK